MCILCVIQKWSRKVATMLPWLVIPLIGLWLLSQFLPPAFRFEITSPRLACVLVLLITLFWYEILMPQLSSWRARRNARLKERKRFEAIEMQKLRKTAIRRCRNCLTPYRDQNPSGGKFMCSYCGHISKRPVLDLSIHPGLGRLSNSGILKDLVGKGEKMFWSDNNWICGQEWSDNNWVNGSLSVKNSGGIFNNDHFFSEKSSFLFLFVCKSFAAVFLGVMWVFKKLFRINLSEDNTSMDSDIRDLSKKGINNENRTEKARRKAEEKRQARLEREQLEEEERKQREEVARLVEERRKLRDEKTVTRNDNNEKRETEKKKQERKKEKDRGSSKSNSDVDEIEKRVGKEIEKNKNKKLPPANSYKNESVGSRYLDRMRGNFFQSSRTLSGGGFFGKGINVNSSNTREQISKKDFVQPERVQNHNRSAVFEPQPCPPPKRSWQQLFTRSPNPPLPAAPISRPNGKSQTESLNSTKPGHPSSEQFSSSIPFGKFEDPCYVPDPTSLIGPVSECLDNFQLDLGFEKYNAVIGLEKPRYVNHNLGSPEVNRLSPIESPVASRLCVGDENRAHEKTNLPLEDCGTGNEKEWQMWNSSPLCLDSLDFMHVNSDDPWALRSSHGSLSTNNHHYKEEASSHSHRIPVARGGAWPMKEKSVEGIGRGIGGLYSSPDVQSVWSYE